jgi:nucleoside-diphosphate-sugar epimerase
VTTNSLQASIGHIKGRQSTEFDWSTTTIEEDPYAFAKRKGEARVWEATEGKPYSVSTINPSMVFGPCLAKPHCKASPFVFRQVCDMHGRGRPGRHAVHSR